VLGSRRAGILEARGPPAISCALGVLVWGYAHALMLGGMCRRRPASLRMIPLLALCVLALAGRASAKGAVITLDAKWSSAPLLLEAAEFLVRGRRSCLIPIMSWQADTRHKQPH